MNNISNIPPFHARPASPEPAFFTICPEPLEGRQILGRLFFDLEISNNSALEVSIHNSSHGSLVLKMLKGQPLQDREILAFLHENRSQNYPSFTITLKDPGDPSLRLHITHDAVSLLLACYGNSEEVDITRFLKPADLARERDLIVVLSQNNVETLRGTQRIPDGRTPICRIQRQRGDILELPVAGLDAVFSDILGEAFAHVDFLIHHPSEPEPGENQLYPRIIGKLLNSPFFSHIPDLRLSQVSKASYCIGKFSQYSPDFQEVSKILRYDPPLEAPMPQESPAPEPEPLPLSLSSFLAKHPRDAERVRAIYTELADELAKLWKDSNDLAKGLMPGCGSCSFDISQIPEVRALLRMLLIEAPEQVRPEAVAAMVKDMIDGLGIYRISQEPQEESREETARLLSNLQGARANRQEAADQLLNALIPTEQEPLLSNLSKKGIKRMRHALCCLKLQEWRIRARLLGQHGEKIEDGTYPCYILLNQARGVKVLVFQAEMQDGSLKQLKLDHDHSAVDKLQALTGVMETEEEEELCQVLCSHEQIVKLAGINQDGFGGLIFKWQRPLKHGGPAIIEDSSEESEEPAAKVEEAGQIEKGEPKKKKKQKGRKRERNAVKIKGILERILESGQRPAHPAQPRRSAKKRARLALPSGNMQWETGMMRPLNSGSGESSEVALLQEERFAKAKQEELDPSRFWSSLGEATVGEIHRTAKMWDTRWAALREQQALHYPIWDKVMLESAAFNNLPKKTAFTLNRMLKPYQREEIARLLHSAEHGISRILSFEMGLGKTLTYCEFLIQRFLKSERGNGLIVVPKHLLESARDALQQWLGEAMCTAWIATYRKARQQGQHSSLKDPLLRRIEAWGGSRSEAAALISLVEQLKREGEDLSSAFVTKRMRRLIEEKWGQGTFEQLREEALRFPRAPFGELPFTSDQVEKLLHFPFSDIVACPSKKTLATASKKDRAFLLTTYSQLQIQVEKNPAFLQDRLHTVILDEAQTVHTPKARITQTFNRWCHSLQGSPFILPVTATPFENNITEVIQLLMHGNRDAFENEVCNSLQELVKSITGDLADAKDEEDLNPLLNQCIHGWAHFRVLKELINKMTSHLRLDSEKVARDWPGMVPHRVDHHVEVHIPEDSVRRISEAANKSIQIKRERRAQVHHTFIDLKHLNHDTVEQNENVQRMLAALRKADTAQEVIKGSPMITALFKESGFQEALEQGEHIIVLIDRHVQGKMLEAALSGQYPGAGVAFFHGNVRGQEREAIIRDFQTVETNEHVVKPKVLLLMKKSGGSGLNLPQATRVFNVSADWNPSVDNQAIARAIRIGSPGMRHVYNFRTCTGKSHEAVRAKKIALEKFLAADAEALESFGFWLDYVHACVNHSILNDRNLSDSAKDAARARVEGRITELKGEVRPQKDFLCQYFEKLSPPTSDLPGKTIPVQQGTFLYLPKDVANKETAQRLALSLSRDPSLVAKWRKALLPNRKYRIARDTKAAALKAGSDPLLKKYSTVLEKAYHASPQDAAAHSCPVWQMEKQEDQWVYVLKEPGNSKVSIFTQDGSSFHLLVENTHLGKAQSPEPRKSTSVPTEQFKWIYLPKDMASYEAASRLAHSFMKEAGLIRNWNGILTTKNASGALRYREVREHSVEELRRQSDGILLPFLDLLEKHQSTQVAVPERTVVPIWKFNNGRYELHRDGNQDGVMLMTMDGKSFALMVKKDADTVTNPPKESKTDAASQ